MLSFPSLLKLSIWSSFLVIYKGGFLDAFKADCKFAFHVV